jgi:hypothetical protein
VPLRLVKTVGGTNGAPLACSKCGSNHFAKSGIAWHCTACGIYHPTSLGFESLKRSILELHTLQDTFKKSIDDLERIVTD